MEYQYSSKPDKGMSWVILAISTFLNMQYGVILFSFGIFYLYFLDDFGQGHTKTAWLGSVIGCTAQISGV